MPDLELSGAWPAPTSAKILLRQAGLTAKKTWGQNFLEDQALLQTIAAAVSPDLHAPVVELGAGLGALTYYLVQRKGQVLAIERDRELAPVLRNFLAAAKNLEVREADAVQLDYQALAQALQQPVCVAGNLPYQLSGRILVSLANAGGAVQRAVLLIQREVAMRLVAACGSRTYGLLSVLVQRTFNAEIICHVPPEVFFPPPKVHSCVVLLTLKFTQFHATDDALLVKAARAAFAARRKTLRNTLALACNAPSAMIAERLVACGIDPQARAETLDLYQFLQIGQALAEFLP